VEANADNSRGGCTRHGHATHSLFFSTRPPISYNRAWSTSSTCTKAQKHYIYCDYIMARKEKENEMVEKLAEKFRQLSDDKLILNHSMISPNCRIEIKKAYKIVLIERGLKA